MFLESQIRKGLGSEEVSKGAVASSFSRGRITSADLPLEPGNLTALFSAKQPYEEVANY